MRKLDKPLLAIIFTLNFGLWYFIIWFIILFTGNNPGNNPGNNLGAELMTVSNKIDIEKISIDTIQASSLTKDKKYKSIPEYTKEDVKYEVQEYKMSNGKVGYQTIITGTNFKKSTCIGDDCKHRVFNISWKDEKDNPFSSNKALLKF